MRHLKRAVLACCLLIGASLSAPVAKAGDYYGPDRGYSRYSDHSGYSGYSGYAGYSGYSRGQVRTSTNCCYRKVVRTVVSYVRVNERRHSGYYGSPYRSSYSQPYRAPVYYGQRHRTPVYYGAPQRYDGYEGAAYRVNHYDNYAQRDAYAQRCVTRRVRVNDSYRGGWVWATTRSCY